MKTQKEYQVTIVWLTNASVSEKYKQQQTFTVLAENENAAKEKAKELDKTLFSVWEIYIS